MKISFFSQFLQHIGVIGSAMWIVETGPCSHPAACIESRREKEREVHSILSFLPAAEKTAAAALLFIINVRRVKRRLLQDAKEEWQNLKSRKLAHLGYKSDIEKKGLFLEVSILTHFLSPLGPPLLIVHLVTRIYAAAVAVAKQ